MIDEKPYSQACENNKPYILDVLINEFKDVKKVLEIGSGTGQHAVHFAANLPHITWQTADQLEYHQGIYLWLQEYELSNLLPPIPLSIPNDPWPKQSYDAIFTANTAHIMQKIQVQFMMQKVSEALPTNGVFCQYGPFTIDGEFSSESNAEFHGKLLASGRGGYRDIEELKAWVDNIQLEKIIEMPANNLMLVWRK